MGFFGVFYCQDSIKSSLKSSAILHFRNPKLKNFSYKASHLQRSTRASKLQFQPPPPPPQPKRPSYGPDLNSEFGTEIWNTCRRLIPLFP